MVHESRVKCRQCHPSFTGHVEIKNLFTWTCRLNFLRLLECGISSLVGNDFNENILKSELIIVIIITNEKFLNHDSPENKSPNHVSRN